MFYCKQFWRCLSKHTKRQTLFSSMRFNCRVYHRSLRFISYKNYDGQRKEYLPYNLHFTIERKILRTTSTHNGTSLNILVLNCSSNRDGISGTKHRSIKGGRIKVLPLHGRRWDLPGYGKFSWWLLKHVFPCEAFLWLEFDKCTCSGVPIGQLTHGYSNWVTESLTDSLN